MNADGFEHVERGAGTFLRRFTLPESAQAEAIKARYADGVLEIAIPSSRASSPSPLPSPSTKGPATRFLQTTASPTLRSGLLCIGHRMTRMPDEPFGSRRAALGGFLLALQELAARCVTFSGRN